MCLAALGLAEVRLQSKGRVVLFVLALGILAVGIARHRSGSGAAIASRYGAVVPPFEATLADGRSALLDAGRWRLVVSLSLQYDTDIVEYLGYLIEESPLAPLALDLLIVAPESAGQVESLQEKTGISLPIATARANHGLLRKVLGLSHYGRRFVLIDPQGQVAFHADFMKPGDLRQLLEKHLTATGRALVTAVVPLAVGDVFSPPELAMLGAATEPAQDEDSARLWLVFTSQCVRCALSSHLLLVSTAESALAEYAATRGLGLRLLFSPRFSATALTNALADLAVAVPALRSRASLASIEDEYRGLSLTGDDVVVIATDSSARVTSVRGLPELVREIHSRGGAC